MVGAKKDGCYNQEVEMSGLRSMYQNYLSGNAWIAQESWWGCFGVLGGPVLIAFMGIEWE